MNEREKILMELILTKNSMTIQEAAAIFGVTERTIRNSLDEIDIFLLSKRLPTLKKQTATSISYVGDSNEIYRKLFENNDVAQNYHLDPEFREKFIFSSFVIEDERYTVDKLEALLQISKSSVQGHIRKLRDKLKEKDVYIEFNKKKGFYIKGNEIKIRELYIENYLYFQNIGYHDLISEKLNKEIIELFIKNVEEDFFKKLSFTSYLVFLQYVSFSVCRLIKGYCIKKGNQIVDKNFEIEIIRRNASIIELFYNINLNDSECLQLLENFQKSSFDSDELLSNGFGYQLNILSEQLISSVSDKLQIDLSSDKIFLKNLSMHFQKRIQQKIYSKEVFVSNEILKRIKEENENVYKSVKESMDSIHSLNELGLSSEEDLILLTIHIASRIEQLKNIEIEEVNVLLICHFGIGTSQFMQLQLEREFNCNYMLGTTENLKRSSENYDLLLSTIDLDKIDTKTFHRDYLKISPYPTDSEKKEVSNKLDEIILKRLVGKFNSNKKKGSQPMLKELLTSNTVKMKVDANNWEEAIRQSGAVLEKVGTIRESYIDKMIENVHEFGPYIVIVPGIALAHASSNDGVNRVSMSLITLSNDGVEFGNKFNDPVHTVICLATVDHDTHLRAMAELVQLLNNKDFNSALASHNKDRLLQLIENEGEKKNEHNEIL